ncbi:MAG: hypothetical protein LBT36_02760, partial [Oscillospiraceae bacterium]|nr:hypothetical protein [Oscillospiraceae bacterium]
MKVNDDIRRRIDAWFAQNRDTLLGDLSRLIGIKSVLDEAKPGMPYGEGAARALECSREILSGLGIGSAVFEDCIAEADVDGSEDAKTSDADAPFVPKLGILVHVDTVAAHDGWTSDPFTAEIRGGVLYGR